MICDRYILRMLSLVTFFTALALAAVLMLTQSLRFLELIIESGASGLSFLILTLLAMPRFLEIILPIALMISTLFIYNRMIADNELVVLRAAGSSPMQLSGPALTVAGIVTLFLFFITSWIAPVSLSKMQSMRVMIKAQVSTILLREGLFNALGENLTVYIERRSKEGDLKGLMIHDSRPENEHPVTILARRGVIVTDHEGQQVIVYDGSRQEYNKETGTLNRLDFKRYTLDLPDPSPVRQRWREPDERTLFELIRPEEGSTLREKTAREFKVEIHRRFASPFLAMTFTLIPLCLLLLGPFNRRGMTVKTIAAASIVTLLQGLYLIFYNLSKDTPAGLFGLYGTVFVPLLLCLYVLSPSFERWKTAARRNP